MTVDRPVLVDSALSVRGRLVLEIQNDIVRTRTRTNTNPNDTEANAAGRSVRACVARKSKS